MIATKTRMMLRLLSAALTCSAACLAAYLSLQDAQGASPPTPPSRMFPDGLEHDFGTLKRGTIAKHVFRVVNTSSAPIQISLRGS
jgi:hypothetical protein